MGLTAGWRGEGCHLLHQCCNAGVIQCLVLCRELFNLVERVGEPVLDRDFICGADEGDDQILVFACSTSRFAEPELIRVVRSLRRHLRVSVNGSGPS